MDEGALPDTDDPFEILGVDRTTPPVEIRRAYVRLLRRFRPERHPTEFQRIQRAWEEIRDRWSWEESTGPEPDSGAQAAPAEARVERERRTERMARLWAAVERGEIEAARAMLRAWLREEPEDAALWTSRFLLEDVYGGPGSGLAVLEESLARCPGAPSLARDLLEPAELETLAASPHGAWSHLRHHPDRQVSLQLFRARCLAGLRDGRARALAEEVLDALFVDDAHDDPNLEHVAWTVMVGAYLEDPQLAAAVAQRHPQVGQHPATWSPWDQLEVLKGFREGLAAWSVGSAFRADLARFIAVAPLLPTSTVAPWGGRLSRDFLARPEIWFDELVSLEERAPGALAMFSQAVQMEPLLEPSPCSLDSLLPSLRGLDDRLAAPVKRRVILFAVLASVTLAATKAFEKGFVVVVASVAPFVVLYAVLRRTGRAESYRRVARPALMRIVLESRLRPDEIAALLQEESEELEQVAWALKAAARDPALRAAYWARRMGEIEPAYEAAALP